MKRSRIFLLLGLAAVASGATIFLLWGTRIPLGVPGEWTWPRIPFSNDTAWGWATTAAFAGFYLGLVRLGAPRISRCGRLELAGWLAGLVVSGFLWLSFAQESPPGIYGSSKVAWVLYYPGSSGYFTAARDDATDVAAFLESYEEKMAKGDYLHIGTHPPGLILLHRGLLELCRELPGLTQFLVDTQPTAVADAFAEIEKNSRFDPHPLLKSERASIWLAALVTQAAVALTLLPLYLLVRGAHSRETAWITVAFWPLFPALAVFLPKSDALYPLLAASFVLAWTRAYNRGSWPMAFVAGLVAFLGMFLTLAFIPVAIFAAVLTVRDEWIADPQSAPHPGRRNLASAFFWAALSFAVSVVVMRACLKINLLGVWHWNYLNHQAFYDHFARTYWRWLLVNPIEFFFAVGAPMGILALAACAQSLGAPRRRQRSVGPFWAMVVVWGLLWISGKNSGEAARLWIILMPWLVWLSAPAVKELGCTNGKSSRYAACLLLLALQFLVCIATVTRLSGFDFNPTGAAG